MEKEITLTISVDGKTEEIVTKEVGEIAEKYGVTFIKKIDTFYCFRELSEDIQQEIIDRNRERNVDYNWWEFTIDYWKEKLEQIGFDNADIRFSGFWSQGDGASFTAHCDSEKILNALLMCEGKLQNYKQWRLWFELIDAGIFKFDISRNSSHYCHEHTISGVIHDDFGGLNDRMWYTPDPNKPFNFTSRFEQKANLEYLEAMFDSYIKDICRKIYSDLEDEYEYLTSDACLKEYLDNNDEIYDINGKEVK